jgi:hypothetical protein
MTCTSAAEELIPMLLEFDDPASLDQKKDGVR